MIFDSLVISSVMNALSVRIVRQLAVSCGAYGKLRSCARAPSQTAGTAAVARAPWPRCRGPPPRTWPRRVRGRPPRWRSRWCGTRTPGSPRRPVPGRSRRWCWWRARAGWARSLSHRCACSWTEENHKKCWSKQKKLWIMNELQYWKKKFYTLNYSFGNILRE